MKQTSRASMPGLCVYWAMFACSVGLLVVGLMLTDPGFDGAVVLTAPGVSGAGVLRAAPGCVGTTACQIRAKLLS